MKKLPEIKKTNNLNIHREAKDGFIATWTSPITKKAFSIVFSWGAGWEHLSVSTPNKTPSWDDMCVFKDMFWNEDETCIEYHPCKADYINNHKHCLHIWKPIGIDFPKPPTELVGVKEDSESYLYRVMEYNAILNNCSVEEIMGFMKNKYGDQFNREIRRKAKGK